MRLRWPIRLSFLVILAGVLLLDGCSREKEFAMSLNGTWLFKIDSLGKGVNDEWFRKDLDRSDWASVHVPDYWDRYNLAGYDGAGWFATTINIADTSKPQVIFFGGVDDDAEVWLDGRHIGGHVGYSDPFFVPLPADIGRGKKELVVRVDDHAGPGGIYKPVSLVARDRVPDMFRTKFSQLTARPSADWVRNAVIYEVYLRSFSKEGTFRALERRLPELRDLGVTVLWLMPIHPIGELNRKGRLGSPYSVQDFYAVNPDLGTLDDFRSLVSAVHTQGMHILLDLVADHTSWDSKLIMEHPEWFVHNSDGAIVSPNADWYDVAALNYGNHELRKYMLEMMKYWVKDVGIDGYRCDVAELVPTDFWDRARSELDKIKPVMMISEGTRPEHHVEAFDLTYSWNVYDVLARVIAGSTPAKIFDDLFTVEGYQFPRGSLRMRFNSNHDKNAWDAPAVNKFSPQGARTTALLTFTIPGVPLIYNGEEVGNDRQLSLTDKADIDWTKNPDFRTFYHALTQLRAQHPALRMGDYALVNNTGGEKVYSFLRRSGADEVLVVINFSRDVLSFELDLTALHAEAMKEYFDDSALTRGSAPPTIKVEGLGYRVFVPTTTQEEGAR